MVKSDIIFLHDDISDEIHCIVYFPVDINIHDLSYLTYFFKYCYSCGLSTATIEYSSLSVCLSVCLSVYMITQKIMVQST